MIEEWRDVVGFEGHYQVSNMGRVRSLDMQITRGEQTYQKRGIVLSKIWGRSGNYVGLSLNGKASCMRVPIIVAKAFVSNPENKKHIIHKDGDKWNDCADNLLWSDKRKGVARIIYDEESRKLSQPIVQYDLQGNRIAEYDGVAIAARKLNMGKSNIQLCLRGKLQRYGLYRWRKKSEAPDKLPPYVGCKGKYLDYDTVVAIKRDLAEDKLKPKDIAEKYGVDRQKIYAKRRKSI